LPRRRELRLKLDLERFFAGLIELGHAAGCAELLGKLCRGRGRAARLDEVGYELPRRNGAVKIPPRLDADPQRFHRGGELGLAEPVGRNVGPRRQRYKRQNVAGDAALDVELDRCRDPAYREGRVGRQARLDLGGLGEAEIVVGRLQPLVVEEGDLDRGVRRQRVGKQSAHPPLCGAGGFGVVGLVGLLFQLRGRNAADRVHSGVRGE
jgi:hypothetical protein